MMSHQAGETSRALPRGLWRTRWAAIGAAIAVTLGGGGLFVATAATSSPSSIITIDPVRILDTRTDIGLAGPFLSRVPRKLQVTGPTVPAGATGVLLNVTGVTPTAAGFISVRPGDATGSPSTSSLNIAAGDIVPNAVQVALPTDGANAGQIDITYDAYGATGPSIDLLVDVVGYLTPGSAGPAGPVGPAGPAGLSGLPPTDFFTSTQIVGGALLTCASTSQSGSATSCQGLKLNGRDVIFGSTETAAICAAVTAGSVAGTAVGGATTPFFTWTGTTWAMGYSPAPVSLLNISCNLSG